MPRGSLDRSHSPPPGSFVKVLFSLDPGQQGRPGRRASAALPTGLPVSIGGRFATRQSCPDVSGVDQRRLDAKSHGTAGPHRPRWTRHATSCGTPPPPSFLSIGGPSGVRGRDRARFPPCVRCTTYGTTAVSGGVAVPGAAVVSAAGSPSGGTGGSGSGGEGAAGTDSSTTPPPPDRPFTFVTPPISTS